MIDYSPAGGTLGVFKEYEAASESLIVFAQRGRRYRRVIIQLWQEVAPSAGRRRDGGYCLPFLLLFESPL